MRELVLALLVAAPALGVEPRRSWSHLPSGNGHGFVVYDRATRRVDAFWERPYLARSATQTTRDLAYDAYFGLRAGGGATWLNEIALDEAASGYVDQSHVVRARQVFGPLAVDQYVFAPLGYEGPGAVMLLRAVNRSAVPQAGAAIYALLNFHLGAGAPEPGAGGERIVWDGSAYVESGPAATSLVYLPLVAGARHGASPENPYRYGRDGLELVETADSGTRDDAVAGFQLALPELAPGGEAWFGVAIGAGADAAAVKARLTEYVASRAPATLLAAELAASESWRVAPPSGLNPAERIVWRQSETVLRMGQVREAGRGKGQILASLPPGHWRIAWVRDMSYAAVALARMGHREEAQAAAHFMLDADAGHFADYVGRPYSGVSVVRYFGDGTEESDSNQDGPNVEFDGFGLFLWLLRESGSARATEGAHVAQTLLDLRGSDGLIAPDSGIWEVHWNGKQKRFTHTSAAAARGLCDAGRVEEARALRDAVLARLTFPGGALAGNYEELVTSAPALDAAAIEAVNFGLTEGRADVTAATLDAMEGLRVGSGRGYQRNDDGGGYDRQEWIFVDLRLASAMRRAGRHARADELVAWVTGQSLANDGLVAELYDEATGDYTGAVPMVGFGAGAYVLALLDRERPPGSDPCFAVAPAPEPAPEGCGCSAAGNGGNGDILLLLPFILWTFRRARRELDDRKSRMSQFLAIGVLAVASCASDETSLRAPGSEAPAPVLGPWLPIRDCDVMVSWRGSAGSVAVAGDFNGWSATATPLHDADADGAWRASLGLAPGRYAYKLVVDGDWRLDPTNPYQRYQGGVANSELRVGDCTQPELRLLTARASPAGTVEIVAQYVDGSRRQGLSATFAASLDGRAADSDVDGEGRVHLVAEGLPRGKHTVRIAATDRAGRAAEPLVVPIWVEPEPFDWRDGPMYFVFTDRFRNGSLQNDAPIAGVAPIANYAGGDLQGVLDALTEGYFDALGVRSLWLSPVQDNPDHSEPGADGRPYAGYHGYWPRSARTVDEHFGDVAMLRLVAQKAHQRGIRVLLDSVFNHVHKEHPYYVDRGPAALFNGDGSCVCGGPSCDWTARGLDCWFTNYLPDVDWTSPLMAERMIDDALFWLTEADVDGFRVDAVKHFQHLAPLHLRAEMDRRLAGAGTVFYTVGETFSGENERGLVSSYVSPRELWGQFDFPLYWPIVKAFARDEANYRDLDGAVRAGESEYPRGAMMSPFLGNHDVPRFLSHAAGQIGDLYGNGSQEQGWTNPPPAPDSDTPYLRARLAFTFLLTQPGVPLIYYGDEIGMPGAGDPDNRRPMRFGAQLSAREAALLAHVRKVGSARAALPALKRGARQTIWVDDDLYVYTRGAGRDVAIVALNRGGGRSQSVPLPATLGLGVEQGDGFSDLLGGTVVTAGSGSITLALPGMTSAIYARQP